MRARGRSTWLRVLEVVLLLFVFLVGIRAMGDGFELLGRDLLESFFRTTENPFIGLCIGILATSLVQSSSVTTSMVVAMVAAPEAPLPIEHAIPMIMGANIGTTVTNSVVSMAHLSHKKEFGRAIAAGTCDDFFNLIAVAILLPLEIAFGLLEKASAALVALIPRADAELPNPVSAATGAVLDPVVQFFRDTLPHGLAAVAVLLFAVALIFGALSSLVLRLRKMSGGKLREAITRSLNKTALVGLLTGAIMTAMVQSSSLTLSVLVPFAATGIVTLEEMFPIVLGANFGTTLTALIAAMALPAATFKLGMQIALVHMMFNLAGVALIYPIGKIREVPLRLSRWIGAVAARSRLHAAGYIVGLFYGLPAMGVAVWHVFQR